MSTSVLPELAAESVETAERLVRLSGQEGLAADETEYLLASGLAAIQGIPRLWPLIRGRIAGGTTAATARLLLLRLLEAIDRNLALVGVLKERTHVVGAEREREPEVAAELTAAEEQLLTTRVEATRLLRVVDVPARWPGEEQLREAKENMQRGERQTSEEFRRALLDE